MKQFIILIIAFFLMFSSVRGIPIQAQTASPTDNHTVREEAEGKAVWEKLQAKELTCQDLSDDNFGTLGEYFMGQMMGSSHEAMNTMMENMMGKEGEEQMHIAMGKRNSGCDSFFIPMMSTGWGNMMGGWNGLGVFGSWFITLFWLVWLVVGVLVAIWLWRQINRK